MFNEIGHRNSVKIRMNYFRNKIFRNNFLAIHFLDISFRNKIVGNNSLRNKIFGNNILGNKIFKFGNRGKGVKLSDFFLF